MKDEDGIDLTPQFPNLIAWACSFDRPGGRRAITLYSSDQAQVLEDNCDELPGLTVDGKMYGSIPVPGGEAGR